MSNESVVEAAMKIRRVHFEHPSGHNTRYFHESRYLVQKYEYTNKMA